MIIRFLLCRFRVSLSPVVAASLTKKGFSVRIEKEAGTGAKFRNADYEQSGAKVTDKKIVYESGMQFFHAIFLCND